MCALSSAEANTGTASESEGGQVVVLPSAAERGAGCPAPRALPNAKPTVYHFPISLPSQQVRLALAEKQVAWTSKIVNIGPANEHLEPWYAELNPALEVPTLKLDETVVTGATSIVNYIEQHFEGPSLLPSTPEERAEVTYWVELQDSFPMRELSYARSQGLTRWFQRWSMRQERGRLRRLIRRVVPQLRPVYEDKLHAIETLERGLRDRAAVQELEDEVEVLLDEIELTLEQRPWLAGERYSLADLMWTAVIARLEQIGFARSIASRRRPELAAWYGRVRERPSWKSMIRRLSVGQMLRIYGPAVAKTFLLVWVLKWIVVLGIGWLIAHLSG